jgi:hypothetical protein
MICRQRMHGTKAIDRGYQWGDETRRHRGKSRIKLMLLLQVQSGRFWTQCSLDADPMFDLVFGFQILQKLFVFACGRMIRAQNFARTFCRSPRKVLCLLNFTSMC